MAFSVLINESPFYKYKITPRVPPQFNRHGSKIRCLNLTSRPMNKLCLFLTAVLLSEILHAQLPVEREPHHKVIQENPYYRLLEGKVTGGDTTPAHVHAANSVVIFLSHSTFGIQVICDKPVIT